MLAGPIVGSVAAIGRSATRPNNPSAGTSCRENHSKTSRAPPTTTQASAGVLFTNRDTRPASILHWSWTPPRRYAIRHENWLLIDAPSGAVSKVPEWFDQKFDSPENPHPGEPPGMMAKLPITHNDHPTPCIDPYSPSPCKQWFRDYIHWMITSKNGREEAETKTTTRWHTGCKSPASPSFTGDEDLLTECRRRFKNIFVPDQMAEDGSFPLELMRTKPYAYSIFQT